MQEAQQRWGKAEILTGAEDDNGELHRKLLAAQTDRNQHVIEREPKFRDTKKAVCSRKRKAKRKQQRRTRRAA